MKKVIFITLTLIIFLTLNNAHAQDSSLMVMRNKIFNECREMGALLENPKDIIVANSMWSSGVMTVSQLDAYFSMVGILNTTRENEMSADAFDYLTSWLNETKKTNQLNIKSLDSITYEVEPSTKVRIGRLKGYFNNLNNLINDELSRVSALQRSLKIKRQK